MLDQLMILLCGAGGLWLTNDPRIKVRRFGPLLGMVSQPFWFYSSYKAAQWGIFVSSIIYTCAWARGIYLYWIKGRFMYTAVEWRSTLQCPNGWHRYRNINRVGVYVWYNLVQYHWSYKLAP